MTLLTIGVLLWAAVHLLPAAGPQARARIAGRLGEGPFRGLFSLLIILSLVLIVVGWRSALPEFVYIPPAWGREAAGLLVFAGFILFVAARAPTNIKRVLRHPQLTGVLAWAIGHLLANGESRSLILFGGLAAWSLVEMIAINRRDGAWRKPDRRSVISDVMTVVIGAVVFALFLFLHRWIAGVPLIPIDAA
jgi:uncharacterized membrane protein